MVTASCGAMSAYGSQRLRKTVRFIRASRRLLVERGELLQDLAGLRHRLVEALLGRLGAAEDVLHLLLDRVADGGEVPEPDPLAVRRGLAAAHLAHGGLLVRVLRQVAGDLERPCGGVPERALNRHGRPPRPGPP